MRPALRTFLALALAAGLALTGCATSGARPYAGDTGWTGAWGASSYAESKPSVENQTLRLIVVPSLGGGQVRVRLSNRFGTQGLEVRSAQVGLRGDGATVLSGTQRALNFGGMPSIVIPPGAVAVSDAVDVRVAAGQALAVSLYLPRPSGPVTAHFLASQTSYAATGDAAASEDGSAFKTTIATWPVLTGVDVLAGPGARTVITFGDSITDGFKSTPEVNARWPDQLSRRLQASGRKVAVVNQAISGNRMWWDANAAVPIYGPSGLSRFDRDVLSVTGATHVIVLLGINDIGQPGMRNLTEQEVSADQLKQGLRQMIARAHARGIKVIAGTMTPFEVYTGAGYYTPAGEAKRQAVNAWIRGGGEFDGVVDFDAALRDPASPGKFLPAYDSGDHLHPNDAGYRVMGETVNLSLFD